MKHVTLNNRLFTSIRKIDHHTCRQMQLLLLIFSYKFLYFFLHALTIINCNNLVDAKEANLTDLSYELNTYSTCLTGTAQFKFVKRTVGATKDGSW